RLTSTAGTNAVLSGIFFGPATTGPTYTIGGTVSAGGKALAGVNFAATGATCPPSDGQGNHNCTVPQSGAGNSAPTLRGCTLSPPSRTYSSVAANQTAQNYVATAVAGTTATFLGSDSATQGNWQGRYGSDGYAVINDTTSYPAYAQVNVSGQNNFTW